MKSPFFFGYGSLVNRATHDYFSAQSARAHGWRRGWRRSPDRALAFLTAIASPGDYIDGLIAGVPGGDWQALDQRERAYQRLDATDQIDHAHDASLDIAIYAIDPNAHFEPDGDTPVLLSYIDVVIQGYLQEFGRQGVAHFFDTTSGWHVPVIDDRAAPIYPRHQTLSQDERALVDETLAEKGARRVALGDVPSAWFDGLET